MTKKLLFLLCLSLALFAVNAHAQTDIYWNAGTGGWEVTTNWSPVLLPSVWDRVLINNNGTANIFGITAYADVVHLGYDPTDRGTIQVSGAGSEQDQKNTQKKTWRSVIIVILA
jgi:hypothetical protein